MGFFNLTMSVVSLGDLKVSREHFPGMGNFPGNMCREIRTPQFSSSYKRMHHLGKVMNSQ